MVKYVAFLRGINVGGNKLIKMADLREVFEDLGLRNVRTYIQSGNVIFDVKETKPETLVRKIEKKIRESLGHEVRVILRTGAELKECMKDDPFKSLKPGEEAMTCLTFLSADPNKLPQLPLILAKENAEVLAIKNRTAFIACRRKPNGTFGFPNALVEKEWGVSATTRNPRTVMKMLDLIEKAK